MMLCPLSQRRGAILISFHKVDLASPCHHPRWTGHSHKVWGHPGQVRGSLSQCEGITLATLDYTTLRCVVSCFTILSYAELCYTIFYFAEGGGSMLIDFRNTDVASIILLYNALYLPIFCFKEVGLAFPYHHIALCYSMLCFSIV